MIRAFLAVELSQELRAGLATVQQELKQRIELEMKRDMRISWAQPASIHLTLKFLGDMDEQVIDPLRAAIELRYTRAASLFGLSGLFGSSG